MDNHDVSPDDRVTSVVLRLVRGRSITREVSSSASLVEIGLTSLDTVKLVLLVEDEFDLMIPLSEITPGNFRSIATISRLIAKLRQIS